jgi:hypothetical protein
VRGIVRFSRSGREAAFNFVELLPVGGKAPPLVLATTLPVSSLADAVGIARVYSLRWSNDERLGAGQVYGQELAGN